jgi:hypothetical protein
VVSFRPSSTSAQNFSDELKRITNSRLNSSFKSSLDSKTSSMESYSNGGSIKFKEALAKILNKPATNNSGFNALNSVGSKLLSVPGFGAGQILCHSHL